ncbi:hypothetical protein PAAG_02283 [Paracoccidioides lutzii Pb01]|uniref:Uncharacterized protein n=1 Tax=Paracoccidioides lutzii (strain ATCC MYA-826 / Pb01) TaxID=502779 RepID=C1GVK6_PARBA|nr:hypothetical protein PAAG_02283 [Paracoccidioides lutzii Pb01]EEH40228.2 hypothetical protein PAAG_02283 [Paracoccidioides lutzii Pb01]
MAFRGLSPVVPRICQRPPPEIFISLEGVKTVGDLVSRQSLGSELDLMSYERYAVEEHFISIKHKAWRPRSDQLCVFRTNEELETLLFVVENKAGHKLRPANLRVGLQPSNFWEEVVQAHEIPSDQEEKLIYDTKQISGAAITQIFDYMIKEGVENGYLTTGQAFIFLRIKEDDPTTLYYHLAEPIRNAEAQDGNHIPRSSTAIASVHTVYFMALGHEAEKRDQEWRSCAVVQFSLFTRGLFDVEYILAKLPAEEGSRTPPDSSYVPSSPLSSNIQQEKTRRPRRLQGCCADLDGADLDGATYDSPSDSSEGDDPSNSNTWIHEGKRYAVVISPPRPPPAKRQLESQ